MVVLFCRAACRVWGGASAALAASPEAIVIVPFGLIAIGGVAVTVPSPLIGGPVAAWRPAARLARPFRP
ncbi:hypothetical protein A7X12_00050 [Sphingomonas sp. TDK1]|nr:hypothetical protein A7X12_00050 [Sphingomonas sp. TDK1]